MSAPRSDDGGNLLIVGFAGVRIVDVEMMRAADAEVFRSLGEQEYRKVLCNFRGVMYLSSSALGVLITLNVKLHKVGCRFVLCNLEPGVYEVLELVKLDRYFTISGEDPDADPAIIIPD